MDQPVYQKPDRVFKYGVLTLLTLILGAIVLPQMLFYEYVIKQQSITASQNAMSSATFMQIQTLRSQLELYQVQHDGDYPTLSQLKKDWSVMVIRTDVNGTLSGTGKFGPYLGVAPRNPFTDSPNVIDQVSFDRGLLDGSIDPADYGWIYNGENGEILALGFDESTGNYAEPTGD